MLVAGDWQVAHHDPSVCNCKHLHVSGSIGASGLTLRLVSRRCVAVGRGLSVCNCKHLGIERLISVRCLTLRGASRWGDSLSGSLGVCNCKNFDRADRPEPAGVLLEVALINCRDQAKIVCVVFIKIAQKCPKTPGIAQMRSEDAGMIHGKTENVQRSKTEPIEAQKRPKGDIWSLKNTELRSRRRVGVRRGCGKNLVPLGQRIEPLKASQMKSKKCCTSKNKGNKEPLNTLVTGAYGKK